MKKLLSGLFALSLLLPGTAVAQTAAQVVPVYQTVVNCPGSLKSCSYPTNTSTALAGTQTNVSLASATSLTVPTGATRAVITVEGTNNTLGVCARWRDDGTAPTASAGSPLAAGTVMSYQVQTLPIQLIQASSATCVMDVAYYN